MEAPNRIGRYRIASVLGAGSFATVYLGRDEALDVPVAVKVLGQNWAYDPDVRRRFIQEAQLLRRVDGTRVVRVHDIGQDDEGRPFFVMDYADRGTVEDRLLELAGTGTRLGVDDVVRLCRQLAAGVREVHQLGVVHRDLKPGNLLLRSRRSTGEPAADAGLAIVRADEHLVVGDLGLARELLGASRLTPAVGTPGYMAPEQLDPAAGLDQRADLFACTAVLHRVVTGQHPPTVAVDPATSDWSGVPDPLRDFVVRGMALDPGQRFSGVDEWLAAAETALAAAPHIATGAAPPMAAGLSTLEPPSGRLAPGAAVTATGGPAGPPVDASLGTLPPTPATSGSGTGRGRWGLVAVPVLLAVAVVAAVVAFAVRGDDDTRAAGDDGAAATSTPDGDDPEPTPGGAGAGTGLLTGAPLAADEVVLIDPIAVSGDERYVYVSENGSHRIRRIDRTDGTAVTIAGTGRPGYSGDGGPALDAELSVPSGIDLTPDGSALLIADFGNAVVRRIDLTSGVITTVAGTGATGNSGDGGSATDAQISPTDVTAGDDGSFYVVDSRANGIRRVDPAGVISRFAGTGDEAYTGDGGPALDAAFVAPYAAQATPDALYVSDAGADVVRRIDLATGTITTVAGNAETGFSGDDGPATEASLYVPDGLDVLDDGSLLVADEGNGRIRRVGPDGVITTVAGTGVTDGAAAPTAGSAAVDVPLMRPASVEAFPDGSYAIADLRANRVVVVGADGTVELVVGAGALGGSNGDGNPATSAVLAEPQGFDFTADGELVLADRFVLRKVGADGVIDRIYLRVVEGYEHLVDDPLMTTGNFDGATDVAIDAAGDMYVSEYLTGQVLGITGGDVYVGPIAGTGVLGLSGDGGPALEAQFSSITGLEAGAGLAVADWGNGIVRGVRQDADPDNEIPDGTLVTDIIVGGGDVTAPQGEGPAQGLLTFGTFDVAVTPALDAIYVTEQIGQRVLLVRADDDGVFVATTVAGTGEEGFSGDGGPATGARLADPTGVAVAADGSVYVSDTGNQRIRRITPDGIIETVAGTGTAGFSGDGGPATEATLNAPTYLQVGPDGALYLTDAGNYRIRRIDLTTGIITTVAGGG